MKKCFAISLGIVLTPLLLFGQSVPSPTEVYGFEPGADYKLANYEMMLDYYDKLDAASDRVQKIEIGETSFGRPMILLFISTEENLQQLDKWREISEKLARAKISEDEARKLSKEGKAIVWVDASMHSNELAPGQMTSELAYKLATEETEEMQTIRENVITLLVPILNPDGLDIISDWYFKNLGTPYETSSPPWLYQKYVGHDNNRDWFMNNMKETKNITKLLYREWFPQIVYNHHQTSPSWTKISIPPYADPVNPNIHPAVTASVNEVGSAMSQRFALEKMPGAIADNFYTMFWNGGARTVPYYHNMIGILTETGHSTPTPRYYDPEKLPKTVAGGTPTDGTDIMYPYPWKGGESHFRDAVDYTYTATMAVLDLAAERHQRLLFNIYRMGRDAIEKGASGPFAYVIPKDQWDSFEATNLVNILLRGGLEVEQAKKDFTIDGTRYSEGSYILYAAQSFRPYLTDLLEKQNYPTRLQYPGGPPDTPYDLAGWTLPMQMGVTVDRIENPFNVSTDSVTEIVTPEKGDINGGSDFGFAFSVNTNASVKAANKLLEAGETVYKTSESLSIGRQNLPAGSFIVKGSDEDTVEKLAEELGLDFYGVDDEPESELTEVKRPKVGIYKSWRANIDEGWTRWLLEDYAFEVDTLHNADIQNGDLSEYDSIILPSQSPNTILHGYSTLQMPEEYTGGIEVEGVVALKKYTQNGGVILAFDAASDLLIDELGLPLRNVVQGLDSESFFIPGSLIRSAVNVDDPLAFGMRETVAVSFNRSRAFSIDTQSKRGEGGDEEIADAPAPNIDVIVNYTDSDLLMSGWAMGEDRYIAGKPAMVRAPVGEGEVILFGFRPQFRGQPRGTYKLIFNALYESTTE